MDTVGFIPLETADPKAGRIVTQWYTPPGAAGERTQLTIEVLDPDLRRDPVRVSVARQMLAGGPPLTPNLFPAKGALV